MTTIFHIATRDDWAAAQHAGSYRTASLEAEGFIHCSTAAQVESTANAFFRGRDDLVLIALDESRLTSEVRYEAAATPAHEASGGLFPHLYGPLNLDAVIEILPMIHRDGGAFAELVPVR